MAESDGSLKIQVDLDTKGFKIGSKDLEAAAKRTAGKISDIGDQASASLKRQYNAVSELSDKYEKQQQKVERLRDELKKLSQQKVQTKEFTDLATEIDKAQTALERLYDRRDSRVTLGKDMSPKLDLDITDLERKLRLLKTDLFQMDEEGKAYQTADTSKLEEKIAVEQEKLAQMGNRASSSYDILNARLDELKQKESSAAEEANRLRAIAENAEVGDQKIVELNQNLARLKARQEELSKAGVGSGYKEYDQNAAKIQQLNAQLQEYEKSLSKVNKQESVLNRLTNTLSGKFDKASSAVKRMAAMSGKGIAAMKNLGRHSDQTGMSLLRVIQTTILFGGVSRLLQMLTSGVTGGFQNLAQASVQTNTSISMLLTALTYLKNAFATAFSPILTVVAPILSGFINMLARAATYVGMFFATLTGAKSFKKAIPVQEDFAAGLQDTASGAGDAAKGLKDAAKAADSYLSPLDEIDRYESNKDSGAGDVGENGGSSIPGYKPPSASEMFEEVPIDSAIKDFADKIKALIAVQDWDGLGELLASKINSVLAKVDDAISWEKVGPKITYFVNAFTQTFNSLVRNINWELMGKTVGDGINTIVNTLLLLITGIDWKLLGSSFARGMNSLVDTVNWWNLGNLIGQKFMIAWNMFYGFVTTLNWSQVGFALANGINGAIAAIDGETIGASISAFVLGLLTMITTAAQNTDWHAVGQTIADMLNAIDWIGLASQLYEAGKALIDGLLTAFSELPAPVILATTLILAFLAAIKMGPAIASAVSAIKTIITTIQGAGGLISALKAVIAMIGGPTTLAIVAIVAVVAGAVALIIMHWDEVKEWMAGFVEWLKSLFLTDWTIVFGSAGQVINDFFSGVSQFFGGIKKIFSGLIDFLTGVFTGNWSKAWSGIVTIFGGFFDMIVGLAKTPINAVIDLVNGMISAVESGLNWVIGGINKIGFTVPDWVPGLGGTGWHPNVGTVSWGRIPRLATGAVIPPQSEFLAVLGDQKRGTNIETPESLLRQIMREELQSRDSGGSRTYRFTAQINRRVLFDEMMEEARARQDQSGNNPFELA